MKQYNVIFAGTVRNVESFIQKNLEHIDKCGGQFNKYSVIIYENDSNDNTKNILLENKKENYYYLFENNITEARRTMRLANGRNKILEKVKELNQNNEYTYLIMIDLDDINYSGTFINSIESCFQYDYDKWDALFGNQTGKYYDLWALRKPGYIDYDCWGEYLQTKDEIYKQKIINIIEKTKIENSGLVEVDSAFGGIAIYKIKSIKNCKYIGEHKNNKYPENNNELCEHVEFNKCIKINGGKIFINTSFYTS